MSEFLLKESGKLKSKRYEVSTFVIESRQNINQSYFSIL